MPIEIRPSDVMFGVAKLLQQGSDLVGGILDTEAEKERVKEVNDGLILSEMARQKDLESYQDPKKVIEVYSGIVDPSGAPLEVGAPQYRALGDVPQSAVMWELDKQQRALEEQIRLTTHNKRAREELIARSRMAALDHRNRVIGEWRSASQGVYLQGVKDYATLLTMDSTTPVDARVAKMQERIADGIGSGWITRDAADTYLVTFEDQLQHTHALNTALKLMTATTEPYEVEVEQGKITLERLVIPEQALENAKESIESNPYYANNPEKREKLLGDVQGKYDKYIAAKSDEQDTIFSNDFVQADTVEKLDLMLTQLSENKFMRGTQKHTWDSWIREKKARILSGAVEAQGADVVSGLYSRLYAAKDANKNPGLAVSIREIDERITDPQEHQAVLAKRNELQKSYEEGGQSTNEDVFYEAYRIANDPYMSEESKNAWIDKKALPGGGLSPEDAMKVRGWVKPYNDNPKRKEAMDAINQAYRLSMAKPDLSTAGKKALALELYNAQIKLDRMFMDQKTTNSDIDAAVTSFLEGKAIEEIMTVLSRATGGAGFPAASAKAGTARELETAREYGLFTQFPKKGTEFETKYRPVALEQERAALARMKITFVSQQQNILGDQEYTASDGNKYVVRQTKVDGNMVERVFKVLTRATNGKTQIGYELVAGQ